MTIGKILLAMVLLPIWIAWTIRFYKDYKFYKSHGWYDADISQWTLWWVLVHVIVPFVLLVVYLWETKF